MSLLTYRPAWSAPGSTGLAHDLIHLATRRRRNHTTTKENRMARKPSLQDQVNELNAAITANDGDAGAQVLNDIRNTHGDKIADSITRDVTRGGLRNLLRRNS